MPPAYSTVYPTLGMPSLVAFLKSKAVDAFQADLNINFFEYVEQHKLGHIFEKDYAHDKIKKRVYYNPELKRSIKSNTQTEPYFFEKVPGADFIFTEELLSSKNLLRYIDDDQDNIFHRYFINEVLPKIKREKYNMVGFSAIAPSQIIAAFTFGRILKTELPDMPIVMGGQWVSLFKEELMKRRDFDRFYDFLIYFEGESPLYSLINAIRTNSHFFAVPNLIYKEKNRFILSKATSEENMDELPCPDYDGLPLRKYAFSVGHNGPLAVFETARGCYWNKCIFCVDIPLPKPSYREKNIGLVIEDIKKLQRKYRVRKIMISNAVFSPWQAKELSEELIRQRVKIKWWAMARFEKEFSASLLRIMKKAGCDQLNFGLESICQRVLNYCHKGTRASVIRRIVRDAERIGLKISFQAMLGLPGEKVKEGWRTISFLLNSSGPCYWNNYYLIPKNIVFCNAQRYGIKFNKNRTKPFKFFYQYKQPPGTIDRSKALEMIKFCDLIRNRQTKIHIDGGRAISPERAEKDGELALLGFQQEALKRHDKAIAIYKKILKNYPASSGFWIRLFSCYENIKDYENAIIAYKKMSKSFDVLDPSLVFFIAKCYRKIGKVQISDRLLDQGLRRLSYNKKQSL